MIELKIISNQQFDDGHSYILFDKSNSVACVIDPAGNQKAIQQFLVQEKLMLKAIAISHGHFDHLYGVENLMTENEGCELYINKNDQTCLVNAKSNLSTIGFFAVHNYAPFKELPTNNVVYITEREKMIELTSELRLLAIHAPGHTPGATVFYSEQLNAYFTGDVIFNGSVGRSDFYRSDEAKMHDSLKMLRQMMMSHSNAKIYPGHGNSSTVGVELEHNPLWD